MCNSGKKEKSCWNDMEELKYLICAIDCCKCENDPPPPSCFKMLPPRIQEVPCIPSKRRPVCCPPPPCTVTPDPCCPCPLPPSSTHKSQPPTQPRPICCRPPCPLPRYPSPPC